MTQVRIENADEAEYPPTAATSVHSPLDVAATKLEMDRGYAWAVLAAAFVAEVLAFAFAYSIGIFRQVWVEQLFPGAEGTVTLAATLQSGLVYAGAIFIGPALTRWPERRAATQYAGVLISTMGILLSAFAKEAWQLIPTVAVLQPVGAALIIAPIYAILFQWFNRYRGIATGIWFSGTGVGGAILPPIMRILLARYSYRTAAIILSLVNLLGGLGAVFFMRDRTPRPIASSRPLRAAIPLDFLRRSPFWAFLATVGVTGLGVFLPALWLPTYGQDIGLSQSTSTVLLVVMNISSIAGQLLLGYLSDRFPAKHVLSATSLAGGISVFLIFGFATNLGVLTAFVIAWGILGQSTSALWTSMVSVASRDDHRAVPTIYGLFSLMKGICSVAAGPISTLLLDRGAIPTAKFGYGIKNYGSMLLFVGAVNVVGSLTSLCYRHQADKSR